jgi:hypothetical protein
MGYQDCIAALREGLWQDAAKLLTVHSSGPTPFFGARLISTHLRFHLDFCECRICSHHAARLTADDLVHEGWISGLSFTGSAQESGITCDWRGFGSFVRFGSHSRRRCGNVGTRVLCGFPSSEGRQNRWGKRSIIPPSERHFYSEAPFIRRSGGNLVFGRPAERNSCLSQTRVECTFFQILAQSPKNLAGQNVGQI